MATPAPQGVDASGLPPAGDQANAVLSGSFSAVGASQPFAFRGPMNLLIWASTVISLTTTAGSNAFSVASATGLGVGESINSVNVPAGTTILTFNAGPKTGTFGMPTLTLPGQVSTAAAQITGLPTTAGLLGSTVSGPGIPANTTVIAISVAAVAATNNSPGTPGVVELSALPTSAATGGTPQQMFSFALTGNGITITGADANAIFTGKDVTYSGTIQVERSFDGGATWIVCNLGGSGTLAQFNAGTPVSITFGEPEKQMLYRLNCTAYASGTINYRISQTGGAAESLAIGPLSGG